MQTKCVRFFFLFLSSFPLSFSLPLPTRPNDRRKECVFRIPRRLLENEKENEFEERQKEAINWRLVRRQGVANGNAF